MYKKYDISILFIVFVANSFRNSEVTLKLTSET